jgi:DNA invertase Pin-like site-specific DNA recombinase
MDFLSFALDLVSAETGIARENLWPLEKRIRIEQGGDRHYIASVQALDCLQKHAAIRAAVAAGAPASAVAERFGVTRQHVYRIATKNKP